MSPTQVWTRPEVLVQVYLLSTRVSWHSCRALSLDLSSFKISQQNTTCLDINFFQGGGENTVLRSEVVKKGGGYIPDSQVILFLTTSLCISVSAAWANNMTS